MTMGSSTSCRKFDDTQLTRIVGEPWWMADGSATKAMTVNR
jgi:hypothetical protein